MTARPPAPRPCVSCPYRVDVPSGIWAAEEYQKLPAYDRPTMEQPSKMFRCHQNDAESPESRICAGWAGCHDGRELLSIRLAMMRGEIDAATLEAVCDYETVVPLFESGREAAEHGLAEIDHPSMEAVAAMKKVCRRRSVQ